MANERALRLMKPSAYLINTARGGVVDSHALARAIEEGWIAGAALDTHEPEPLPMDSPLRELDPMKVILTPHSIANSAASRVGGQRIAAETLLRAMRGELPDSIINPDVVDRWWDRLDASGLLDTDRP